jgi:hypothetical protein
VELQPQTCNPTPHADAASTTTSATATTTDAVKEAVRQPKYEVEILMSMHVGWVVEAPVGSAHKIDVSLFSPHLELVACMTRMCQSYDVCFLVTEAVHALLSPELAVRLRCIDRLLGLPVAASGLGATIATSVFCFDLNRPFLRAMRHANGSALCFDQFYNVAYQQKFAVGVTRPDIERRRRLSRVHTDTAWETVRALQSQADRTDDSTLSILQQQLTADFFDLFHLGVTLYVSGDWQSAREYLVEVLREQPYDGPTHSLLRFMARAQFQAPADWAGGRSRWRDHEL